MREIVAITSRVEENTGADKVLGAIPKDELKAVFQDNLGALTDMVSAHWEEVFDKDQSVDSTACAFAIGIAQAVELRTRMQTLEQYIHTVLMPLDPKNADLLLQGLFSDTQLANNN